MFRRRGIIVLLVLCFLMSLLPVGAFAQDTAEETLEEIYLNPLYDEQSELQRLEKLTAQSGRRGVKKAAQSGQVYTTLEDAALSVRSQLEARSTTVTVSVQHSTIDNELASDIFDLAVEHTGVPTQGDYLGWEIGGWRMSGSRSYNGSIYTYNLTYTVDHYSTAEQEQTVDTLVDQALAGMELSGKTREERIRTIYDYVCDHVTYDYDNLEDEDYKLKYTAYAAIANGTAVCQGYSVLLYRMMLESGIDCRVIVGQGNGGDHAWNIVKLGGVFYCMDATWDSVRTVHHYELCGLEDFDNHTRDADYTADTFTAAFPTSDLSYVSGSAKDSEALTYLINDGSAVITECSREISGSNVIPDLMDGVPVTTIGFGAFSGCRGMTSVTIPASVTAVSDYAFSDCGALTDVVFLGTQDQWSAISVGSHNEALTAAAIHFEPVMQYVDSGICGRNTSWVLDAAGTVTISGSGGINATSFSGRTDMICFDLADDVKDYYVNDGVIYDNYGTLIAFPAGRTGDFTLPNFVTSVAKEAFSGCSLTSVTIPEQSGFLAEKAFQNCTALRTVCFEGPLVMIGRSAFSGCIQLEQVQFEDYQIPENDSWEGGCIEFGAFSGCTSLKSIDIPDYVTRITGSVFSDCTALERVSLPADLTVLTELTFLNCGKLKQIQIPSGVQLIEDGAFGNCIDLSSVTIPSSVNRILSGAFYGCDGLETVVFDGTPEEWNAITIFEGNDALLNAQIQFLKEDEQSLSISSHPQPFYGDPGSTAEFTVVATGEGLTYQWYFSDDGVTWGKSGSTGWNTDTLQPVLRANNSGRLFKCVITDAEGNVVETEPAVMALLSSEVTIVDTPEDYVGYTYDSATFHVEAEGENLTYLWYFRDSDDVAWAQTWADGYNTDTLTVTLLAYRDGRQFRCEIKSGGENVVYTEPVTMSLAKTDVEVLSQTEDMTAKAMTLVQFHVDAEGENLTYRWYVKQGADAEWEPSFNDGYNSDTLNVRLYEYRDGYQYKCEIMSGGKNPVETDAVTLRMIPKTAAITSQPESVCSEPNKTVTFSVGATGEELTYQWQFRKTAADAWANTGMTGNQTDTLTVVAIAGRSGYQFRCAVTDSSGSVTYTTAADLKVGALPKIISQPQSYVGAPTTTAVFSVEAEGEGLTYQWYYQDASGAWTPSGAADAKSAAFSVAAYSYRDGYQYRCAVTNAEGLTVYTDAVMLSIIK